MPASRPVLPNARYDSGRSGLFDPHQAMADVTQLELDHLGALHGIDPLQHVGVVLLASHPLHGLLEAAFIDDKGIRVGVVHYADHPDALLKRREFGKERGPASREPAPCPSDPVFTVDEPVCHN